MVVLRSAKDVLQDHLDRRKAHDLEGDLTCNYDENLIVMSKDGVFHGKDGIRHTAAILRRNLPNAKFSYDIVRVEGEIALLSWSAEASNGNIVCEGADTFLIKDGRIVAQTIHYGIRTSKESAAYRKET